MEYSTKTGWRGASFPCSCSIAPWDSVCGLGTCGGGGRRLTHSSLLLAQICTSVLLGILGCQFSFESYQPAWDVPPSRGSHLLCLPLAPSDIPQGLSSSAHAHGSTQGCSVSEAALPTSPCVVGLIKVSVFCTGDCVGLSQTGFAPALGAEPAKPRAGAFGTGKRPCGGTCHVGG